MKLMSATGGARRAVVRGCLAGLVLSLLWVATSAGAPPTAEAHGKELDISVMSLIPDPERPLTRLYRVHVAYAGDRDPIQGATVLLSAVRQEGGPGVESVRLTPLKDAPGLYVGEVAYPRFGAWSVQLEVSAALAQGAGQTEFVDSVRPRALSDADEAALKAEGERVFRLQLFFRFGWWPDLVNIVVRVIHSLSAVAYFGVTGGVLFLAWFGSTRLRPNVLRRATRYFLPVTLASLLGLLATGLYSAAFDSPTEAPGIYDLDRLLSLPYGQVYFAAFLVKPLGWLVLVFLAFRIHAALRETGGLPTVSGGAQEAALDFPLVIPRTGEQALKRLALLNGGMALLLVIDLAVLIYLHYLSHLGVFLPSG